MRERKNRREGRKEGRKERKEERKERKKERKKNKQRKDLTNLDKGYNSSSSIVSRTHNTHVNTLTTATIFLLV